MRVGPSVMCTMKHNSRAGAKPMKISRKHFVQCYNKKKQRLSNQSVAFSYMLHKYLAGPTTGKKQECPLVGGYLRMN